MCRRPTGTLHYPWVSGLSIFCSAPVRCWMWTWTRVLMWYSSMRWRRPERYPSGRSWNGFDKSWEGWTGAPAAMPIIGGPGWKEPCLQSKPGSPERETAPAFQRNGLKSGSCSFRFSTAESDFPYCPNRSRPPLPGITRPFQTGCCTGQRRSRLWPGVPCACLAR